MYLCIFVKFLDFPRRDLKGVALPSLLMLMFILKLFMKCILSAIFDVILTTM